MDSIVLSWDAFGIIYLLLSWNTIYFADKEKINKIAVSQDKIHRIFFTIILFVIILIFITILFLRKEKNEILIYIHFTGAFISWMMLHTIFGFHYANLYYNTIDTDNSEKGMIFPRDKTPSYIDFESFSFIIGMTFQIPNVIIVSGKIKRVVFWHSILSFLFNTLIIALSVNVVSSL